MLCVSLLILFIHLELPSYSLITVLSLNFGHCKIASAIELSFHIFDFVTVFHYVYKLVMSSVCSPYGLSNYDSVALDFQVAIRSLSTFLFIYFSCSLLSLKMITLNF